MWRRYLRTVLLELVEAIELSDEDRRRTAKQLGVSEEFVQVVFTALKTELVNLLLRGKII